MADWVDLIEGVKSLACTALLSREEAGDRLQSAIQAGKIRTRGVLLLGDDKIRQRFSLMPDEKVSDIPAPFWRDIIADWTRDSGDISFITSDTVMPDDDGVRHFEIGDLFVAEKVEAFRRDVLMFLREPNDDTFLLTTAAPVKNRIKKGGRPATINWGGLAGHIAAWTIDNGVPTTHR